jgi:selenocysteine lyase/cysteine desulfurase
MPFYANTHTESSGTGLQTTRLREDARSIILEAVGGNEDDVVIFAGSGATGAIDKLITVLGLKLPLELDEQYHFRDQIPEVERPVVFVGPYEHHSNDVTWRMSIADTVMIMEDKDGRIDEAQLEQELVRYSDRRLKIGSFSAASNVTGIISDDKAIAALLHKHGALSFWDYAAASPYVSIDMNPTPAVGDQAPAHKDAIFISPHKFIGGPGTPGVLVAKKALFKNKVPSIPGGGTVTYVSTDDQAFLEDPVHREEGGTPAIIESIRAGLVFQLKQAVGATHIEQLEHDFVHRAINQWSNNPNIWILGNPKLKRLSIISLVIRHGEKFLHWNYVVALLNDLFGIQARGGCSCAGPYGHILFGIGPELSHSYQCEINKGYEGIKPGWVRVNFNYFISEEVFNYIVAAVDLIATHGWKFLPLYRFNPRSSMWAHRDGPPEPVLRLTDLEYTSGELEVRTPQTEEPDQVLVEYLERAGKLLENAGADYGEIKDPELPDEVQALRWFPMPGEITREITDCNR